MPVSGAACAYVPISPNSYKCSIRWKSFLGDWQVFPVESSRWIQIRTKKYSSLILCCRNYWLRLVSGSGEQPGLCCRLPPAPPPPRQNASQQCGAGGAAAPGSLLRAAVLERAAPAVPASFGLGVPASNQSSFMLSLQTRAQTFNHSS